MSEGFILLDLIYQVLLFVEGGCVVEFGWILNAYQSGEFGDVVALVEGIK